MALFAIHIALEWCVVSYRALEPLVAFTQKEDEVSIGVYGFLTTEPNAIVAGREEPRKSRSLRLSDIAL